MLAARRSQFAPERVLKSARKPRTAKKKMMNSKEVRLTGKIGRDASRLLPSLGYAQVVALSEQAFALLFFEWQHDRGCKEFAEDPVAGIGDLPPGFIRGPVQKNVILLRNINRHGYEDVSIDVEHMPQVAERLGWILQMFQ